jgi:uncharacterized membrane protein YccC
MLGEVIARYAALGLALLLAVAGLRVWMLERSLAAERLDRETERREAWEERADALGRQAGAFDEALAREQRARDKARTDFAAISKQLEQTNDLNSKLAESLRRYINFLRDRAASAEAGLSPASGSAIEEREAPTGEPASRSDEQRGNFDGA